MRNVALYSPSILLVIQWSFLSLSLCQITAFDELQADFKVPIDQGNPLHAVGLLSLFIFIHTPFFYRFLFMIILLSVCCIMRKKWKVPHNAKTLQEVVLSLSQYILTVFSLFLFPLISNQAVGNILVLYAVLFSLPGWQADSYYKTAGPSVKYEWLIFYKKKKPWIWL